MRILVLIMIAAIASPAAATDFSVVHMASDGNVRYLHVATGDVDGDGVADMGVLRLTCSGGAVSSAAVHAPRDVATGQSSGKRMHRPFTIVKEWGPAPAMSASVKPTYDVKTMKGARMAGGKTMAVDDWHQVSVTGVGAACDSSKPVGKVSVSDLSITK